MPVSQDLKHLAKLELERREKMKEMAKQELKRRSLIPMIQEEKESEPEVSEIEENHSPDNYRQAKRFLRAGASGIASIADTPNLAALALHAAGWKKDPTFYKPFAERTEEFIDELTKGELKPRNKMEEYADVLTGALAPMGMAGIAGKAARFLGRSKGIARYKPSKGDVASQVGAASGIKAYTDLSDEPGLGGTLTAGVIGSLAGKTPSHLLKKSIGKATHFSPEKYTHQRELGLPVTLGSTGEGRLNLYLEQLAEKYPPSMHPMLKHAQAKEEALLKNLGVQDIDVQNLPKELAKEGAYGYKDRIGNIWKTYEKRFKNREDQAKRNVEQVRISDLYDKLAEHGKGLASKKELQDFSQTIPGKFKKQIEEYSSGLKELEDLKKAGVSSRTLAKIETNPTISYAGLDQLRKQAKKLKETTAPGSLEYQEASEIYHALANKRHEFMETTGSEMEKHAAFRARSLYNKYANKEEGGLKTYVNKILNTENHENAFHTLTKDARALHVAIHGLPKDKRAELTKAIIGDLGERQGVFNISTAFTNYTKLAEPVRTELLNSMKPLQRKAFENTMHFIGENKREIEKIANTSQTAHTKNISSWLKKGIGALAVGYVEPMALATFIAGNLAIKKSAKLWKDQKFIERLNNVITAKTPKAQKNHVNLLLKLPLVKGTLQEEE